MATAGPNNDETSSSELVSAAGVNAGGISAMKKLKDINWNQVYYFYEVARKLSMKEAAEVTGVSIPTVSEQIKRLEVLLETQLFHRRPRRIELTIEGETLYKHARQMFESGLRFLDVVSPTVIGGYPVRVGLQETFATCAAQEFLLRYFDAYAPFGTIHTYRETNSDRLVERIYNGELDWAIGLQQPVSPRLEFGKIGSAEVVFCASAEVVARYKSKAELFQALPLAPKFNTSDCEAALVEISPEQLSLIFGIKLSIT